MATQPQNVVYYDGVPYISSAPQPQQNSNPYGANAPYLGMGSIMGTGLPLNTGRFGRGSDFDSMMARGYLTPLKSPAPTVTRPPPELGKMPEPGWSPQGQAPSLDSILNGSAPTFAAAPGPAANPAVGLMPPPAQGVPQAPQMASAMPSPQKPQQNFDALGQNLMQQVLNGGGR